jgi:hypothetical protein
MSALASLNQGRVGESLAAVDPAAHAAVADSLPSIEGASTEAHDAVRVKPAQPVTAAPGSPVDAVSADTRTLGGRFFGAEADAIAQTWAAEATSRQAPQVEDSIWNRYTEADALKGLRDIECHTTLCRIQLDKHAAMADQPAVTRLAGKLGSTGWMRHGDEASDELLVFVPIDFESAHPSRK